MLIPIKNAEARLFYAQKTTKAQWSKRELRKQTERKVYERTEISKAQNAIIKQSYDSQTVIFKDPYFLDFLGLKDGYLEKDLESAIIKELENFILELGVGFSFVERQKRMIIDGKDFYLDLLFFHRKFRTLDLGKEKMKKFFHQTIHYK